MGEHTTKRRTRGGMTLLIGALAVAMLTGCGDDQEKEKATEDKPKTETESGQVRDGDTFLASNWDKALLDVSEIVTISEVVDGDTIIVKDEDGKEETVQLAMIQAPDYHLPDDMLDEGFGMASFDKTVKLSGVEVRLERADIPNNEEGHTIGYIWTSSSPKNTLFNERLLEAGLAKLDTSESDDKYLDRLQDAESKAKAEGKGIWGEEGYVTNDGFNQ